MWGTVRDPFYIEDYIPLTSLREMSYGIPNDTEWKKGMEGPVYLLDDKCERACGTSNICILSCHVVIFVVLAIIFYKRYMKCTTSK